MTYVIGIKNGPVTVTICDSRVTFEQQHRGLNYALKNGKLFPGCTYAAVGNAESMRKFVSKCKSALDLNKSLPELWSDFLQLVNNENFKNFKNKDDFQLLLSSRHRGEPHFYIFDSRDGSVSVGGQFVTLGSGRQLLDGFAKQFYETRNSAILEYLARQQMPLHLFGYFYCLAFMELAQGDQYQRLNKAGVGGVFHFSVQTSDEEYRQGPAVYVVVTSFPQKRTNTLTSYRVCFAEMALIVEDGATNSFNISLDSAEWPEAVKLTQIEKEGLRRHLTKKALDLPFYDFMGLGFGQERFRGNWLPHINLGNDEYVVTRNNINSNVVNDFVEAVVNGHQERLIENNNGTIPVVILPGIGLKED